MRDGLVGGGDTSHGKDMDGFLMLRLLMNIDGIV